jgi:hypothetical protein
LRCRRRRYVRHRERETHRLRRRPPSRRVHPRMRLRTDHCLSLRL